MKRLAVCISGSLRSIEYCIKNFIENIIVPNQKTMNITLFYYIPNDANSKKINYIQQLNAQYTIKNDIALPIPNIRWSVQPDKKDNVSKGGISGYLQQLYGIEQSYLMMENYEKENNITFDYILRVRSDVIFKEPIILDTFSLDKIIVPNFHFWLGINDRFAVGNREAMITYMHMYSNIYKISKSYLKQNNTPLFLKNAEHFAKINLEYNKITYLSEQSILFNRVRMDGTIVPDSF